MRNYHFNEKLDWSDFQNLACEVVQEREQIQLQTFKAGADEGVDGLWFDRNRNIVVQAKRYRDFRQLYQELKYTELPKVQRLDPDRYILVISLELKKEQADKIYQLFGGYIRESQDLITGRELNDLLSRPKYRFIERSYTKLWLPDTELAARLLEETIHRQQIRQNRNAYQKALGLCQSFVQTRIYREALAKMEQNHTIVISGEPGMGKTTLACILALEFLDVREAEGFIWAESIEKIEEQWEYTGTRQVFILDDFWGSVLHQESGRRASRKLEDLIYRIKNEEKKRLIITSREYIVQQEISRSPMLKDMIETLKLECVLEDYSDAEKARIFFSHLKASDLEVEYMEALFGACDRIVSHPGYSPRVIGEFLKKNDSEDYSPADYAEELLFYLDYPERFWREIFVELSEEARITALLIGISYTPIGTEDIRITYGKYIQLYWKETAPKSFEACISELEKTLITTYYEEDTKEVRILLNNPSIEEFLHNYLKENQEFYLSGLCQACAFYNQLLTLMECVPARDEEACRMLEERCVREFYTLPMKLEEYGDPLFEERMPWEETEWANTAYHLARISRMEEGSPVRTFITGFVERFFDQMDQEGMFQGVNEKINFIGLVRVCEQKGIHFDGRTLMEQYQKHAFLAMEWVSFKEFAKIYPRIFAEISSEYLKFMKAHIKDIILESLEFFRAEDELYQMDLLTDEIPDILKEYGLRYTEKYKLKIQAIAGRYHEKPKGKYLFASDPAFAGRKEDEDYEQAKEQGYGELFWESDYFLEEKECVRTIRELKFSPEMEQHLLAVMESKSPWYVYEMFRIRQNLQLFRSVCETLHLEQIPLHIDLFMNVFLFGMTKDAPELSGQMVGFCAEYAAELFGRETPRLTEKKFKSLPVYEMYLVDNPQLEKILFEHILVRQDKWVDVKNELLMLYFLCRVMSREEEFDWETVFSHFMPRIAKKNRGETGKIYQPEFEPYRNEQWESWTLRLLRELDGGKLYRQYILPCIKEFLSQISENGDRVLGLLERIQLQISIDADGEISSEQMYIPDELHLIEGLHVAYLSGTFVEKLTEEELRLLGNRKSICEKRKTETMVYVYREKNAGFLKKCGIYRVLEEFLSQAEAGVDME